jgi:two-component system, OmpR family, response regulator
MAPPPTISVLILDDEAHIRQAVADYLLDEGRFKVREAGTADEAASLLEAGNVDVCLVDLRLQGSDGRDGFSFIEEVRRRHPRVSFLIQTGSFEADVRERALAAGIAEGRILLKPFRLEALVAAIDASLEG